MRKVTRIGIVVPTRAEREPLLHILERMTEQAVARVQRDIWRVDRVRLGGELLVHVIHAGVGMVNAGAATEALCLYERPQIVLAYGIAGAHTPEALPGDMLVATHVCAPFNGYLRAGGTLDSAFGIHEGDEGEEDVYLHMLRSRKHLPCDPGLVRLLGQAAEELVERHQLAVVAPVGQEQRAARVFQGVIASADTYCQDKVTVARLRERFGSLGEDMESAAVGQIATRHAVPFAVVRCLSNNDQVELLAPERKRTVYPEMMRRAAQVTARFLQLLSTPAE